MTLLPDEQRKLLRTEWSLRGDPGLMSALEAFSRRRFRGTDPVQERLSPWHPVLWRAALAALIALAVALVVLALVLALA